MQECDHILQKLFYFFELFFVPTLYNGVTIINGFLLIFTDYKEWIFYLVQDSLAIVKISMTLSYISSIFIVKDTPSQFSSNTIEAAGKV